MRGKSIALLVLALGCGLVAALGITQILARRNNDAPPTETVSVVVAAKEINAFTLVTNEMVTTKEWAKDNVPPGAIVRVEDVVGRYAKARIFGGDLFIDPKLLARGENPADSAIPKGLRVVTVPVEMVASNGGLVLPNSRVDVQLFVRKGQDPSIAETITQTILQDVRVYAVNDVTNVDPNEKEKRVISIQGHTVSLLVTPQQAGIVTAAAELGSLRLIMRSLEDREQPKISPVTPRGLLGVSDGMNRSMEDKNKDGDDGFGKMYEELQARLREAGLKKAAAPEPTRWAMRVVAASNVNDVVLQTFDRPDDAIWASKGLPEYPRPQAPQQQAPGATNPAPAGAGLPATSLGPPASGVPASGAPANGTPGSSAKQDLFHPSTPSP